MFNIDTKYFVIMVRANWTDDEIKQRLDEIRQRTMKTESSEPPIKELCERVDRGKLELQPDFQRKYVWDDKPKVRSKLIESVLMRVPIPVIYTAELDNGREVVVDGQQRLKTFLDFRKNDGFRLSGLEVMEVWSGSRYSDLPQEIQDLIDSYPLRVIKILKDTVPDIKYDVFERLNRGSVPLNDQEIRNCIYRGNFNELIKRLTHNADFLRIQRFEEPHNRMKDAERVLRFFVFSDTQIQNYKPKIRTFLNEYMENNKDLTPERLTEKESLFKKCVELCSAVFGKDLTGRKWIRDEGNEPNGTVSSTFNEGIFDAQMVGFIDYEKRDIIPLSQMVRDAYIDLSASEAFSETTMTDTYGSNNTKKRMELWFRKLRDTIGYPSEERRAYTSEEKQKLFERNATCSICKNTILDVNDAHVDHLIKFSEGGKTNMDNAQLTHRFCNLSKN